MVTRRKEDIKYNVVLEEKGDYNDSGQYEVYFH
jgi:hypothetical protein